MTIPAATPSNAYFVLACADVQNVVGESNEGNNCIATAGATVTVARPDLVETTATTNPPAPVRAPGTTFTVSDTVRNAGPAPSGPSTTRYYLSDTTVELAPAIVRLTGSRAVPALAAGASHSGTVTVTIPAATALSTHVLYACADDLGVVAEIDDENNCIESSTVTVTRPDLVESTVSAPPATKARGTGFPVTDAVQNVGAVASGASATRYYLSLDAVKSTGDALLNGSRTVPGLAAGASHSGTVTVTIPAAMPLNTYFLLACADAPNTVVETDETNNCKDLQHHGSGHALIGRVARPFFPVVGGRGRASSRRAKFHERSRLDAPVRVAGICTETAIVEARTIRHHVVTKQRIADGPLKVIAGRGAAAVNHTSPRTRAEGECHELQSSGASHRAPHPAQGLRRRCRRGLEAVGTQNYICLPSAAGVAWTFFGPQATLFKDNGGQIITHFLSPNPDESGTARATWQHSKDTSTLWAAAIASSSDPRFVAPGAIPWLLLRVVGDQPGPSGSDQLLETTLIQRLNTSGGMAPSTGCSRAADVGAKALVSYTADYVFYKGAQSDTEDDD